MSRIKARKRKKPQNIVCSETSWEYLVGDTGLHPPLFFSGHISAWLILWLFSTAKDDLLVSVASFGLVLFQLIPKEQTSRTGGVLAMEHSYYGLLLQLGDFGGWNVDHRLMPTHSQHRKQRTKPSIWNENLILTASKIKNEQCTRDSDEYHDRSCATRISIIETILDWPRTFCRGSRSSFTDHPFRQFRFWWPKPKSSWSCLIGHRHLLAEHWAYHDRLDSVVLQVASTIRKQHKHKRLIKRTKMS